MRYCNNCHRITTGQPLFCNFCGRSYNLKLCPHRHPNPRHAEICSQCGSRELSTPHPRVSVWFATLLAFLSAMPGLLLVALTFAFLLAFIQAMATNPQLQGQFFVAVLMLAFVWYLYLYLPHFLKGLLTRLFRRSGDHNQRGGHGH